MSMLKYGGATGHACISNDKWKGKGKISKIKGLFYGCKNDEERKERLSKMNRETKRELARYAKNKPDVIAYLKALDYEI